MHIQNSPKLRTGHGMLFELSDVRGYIAGTQIGDSKVPLLRGVWLKK